MTSLPVTVFTTDRPLAKELSLDATGSLKKKARADMVEGLAQVTPVADLAALAVLLEALTPTTPAVAWGTPKGLPPGRSVRIATRDDVASGKAPGAIPRDREHFEYRTGPAVMMLDIDQGDLTADQVLERLFEAVPELEGAPMLWRPSSSAGVMHPDGRELTGLFRHRFYIAVTSGPDIPAAGSRLITRLWAAEQGSGRFAWAQVSSAGQALMRSLLDAQVWQPERLDFAGPPILRDGLTRPDAGSRLLNAGADLFDLLLVTVSPAQERAARAAQQAARQTVAPQAHHARAKWAKERAPELAVRAGITPAKAEGVLLRAVGEKRVLTGEFMLRTRSGLLVSVADMLADPDQWDGTEVADPLDPDDDLRVAFVRLKTGGRPFLWTNRHGGLRFELRPQSARIQTGPGMRTQVTDAVIQVCRELGDLFDYGDGAIAYVTEGRVRIANPDALLDYIGRVCEFYRVRSKADADGVVSTTEIQEDASPVVARAVLARTGSRRFPKLIAVITAPTLRADGSILDRPGFDEDSGLFLWQDEPSALRIPEQPFESEALAALRVLWEPFRLFPLVDDTARGVLLHALLTACLRASLPTAPGTGLDATSASTGKTLLARCIGILTTGDEPAILPPADADEETRKRLFSALRDGMRVLLWDNVRERLGNAALDAFLTAESFADRVLGSSEMASLPNRAIFIATGNNLRLVSDTCRRVLVARMDAKSEAPYTREFDFCPAQTIKAARMRFVVAALTIVRAYITAGRPKVARGRTGSFELWDDLVRQPICWLSKLVEAHNVSHPDDPLPTMADPMRSAATAFENDPETTKHAALLEAWHAAFGNKPTRVASAINQSVVDDTMREAVDEIASHNGRVNPRILGRWVERMAGRRIGGKFFERAGLRAGNRHWTVVSTDANETPPDVLALFDEPST